MTKVCFPQYRQGLFASLADAVAFLGSRTPLYLKDIVRYNTPYRDCLRDGGVPALTERLMSEVPEIASLTTREDMENTLSGLMLGPYDVLCVPIDTTLTLKGHTFHGLADIRAHVTVSQHDSIMAGKVESVNRRLNVHMLSPLKVVELWQRYPCFDSDDYANEDRYYTNYFFISGKVTTELLDRLIALPQRKDRERTTENLPPDLLPVVYYVGEGDYMIVAKEKQP